MSSHEMKCQPRLPLIVSIDDVEKLWINFEIGCLTVPFLSTRVSFSPALITNGPK